MSNRESPTSVRFCPEAKELLAKAIKSTETKLNKLVNKYVISGAKKDIK